MTRICWPALFLLAACSPEDRKQPSPPPAEATPVPYKQLDWDSDTSSYLFAGKPFTGVTIDHYKPSGILKARYHVKDGVLHGLVEEWYDNGRQKTKTSWENGKHQGDNFYWNPDGTLQVHKVWKDNILVSETPGPKE